MKKILKVHLILILLLVVGIGHVYSAATSITATPVTSGNELNFQVNPGIAPNPCEVRIRTFGTTGRYEIRQELLMAPSSGANQIDWRYFSMRALRESPSVRGTLHAAQDTPFPLNAFNPLYTNTAGTSDSFVLVYYVSLPANIQPGSYRGRIRYTLAPIQAADQQSYAFLNVLVNVGQSTLTSVQKPQIEITPIDASSVISLNPTRDDKASADVEFRMNVKPNSLFSITQVARDPIMSSSGATLDDSVINFKTQNIRAGMGVADKGLSSVPKKIFTSGPGGQCPDSFVLTYSLGDMSGYKAGRYRTKIQYYLDQSGRPMTLIKTLDIQIEVESIFELTITPQDQKGILEFRDIKSGDEPKTSEIVIEAKTNTGKQYQVNQNVYSSLTNKSGDAISNDYFFIKTDKADGKKLSGALKYPNMEKVKTGDSTLFISDIKGSPAAFKVIYKLDLPREVNITSGDYSTRITYSLSEI